jgi:hypothetical protein
MRYYRSIVVLMVLLGVVLMFTRFVNAEAGSAELANTAGHANSPTQAQQANLASSIARDLGLNISGQASASASYSSYMFVSDDHEKLKIEIPSAWNDIESGHWMYQGRQIGLFITAAADLQAFSATKKEPGVFLGASQQLAQTQTVESLLELEKKVIGKKCKVKERKAYQDAFYTGSFDSFIQCTQGNHNVLVVAATTADRRMLILLRMNIVSDADLAAATRIFATFQALGNLDVLDEHHDH